LAVGIFLCLLGAECLVVHQFVLTKPGAVSATTAAAYDYTDPLLQPTAAPEAVNRVIQPPEWAPFSLLSAGAIVSLYAFALKAAG
jgi:hypothetical protein